MSRITQFLNLIDIWKIHNPNKIMYTRRENTNFGFVQSRIDYFLVSCHLQYVIHSSGILPSICSDHSLLQITVVHLNEQKGAKVFGN